MITTFIRESDSYIKYRFDKGYINITFKLDSFGDGNYLQLGAGYKLASVKTNWEVL